MSSSEPDLDTYDQAVAQEYHLTLRVLAVVAEQLLAYNEGEELIIADAQVLESPDIIAWRDEKTSTVHIKVQR